MKKILTLITCLLVFAGVFTGCGSSSASGSGSKKLSIVTTIFPEYDWVRNIVGDREKDVDLTMLIDNGVDLHSYQPSTDDIVK
ncbi:MAG: zinc ABC transporter substrate-binding protein, partial [Ruminococcus sp.]|nr:zinc ABC transporter substrate-binding protein [Ruminococcus sp.]